MGRWALLAAAIAAVTLVAPGAQAAFPEAKNGRIAFQRSFNSNIQSDVFIMNADGSGLIPLTSTASPLYEETPVFSPDGRWIAFQRFDGDQYDVWLMRADGSAQVNLTNTAAPTNEQNPAFSPDGTKLAFDRSSSGGRNVFVMNLDGSGEESVVQGGFDPTWTSDGQGLFFTRSPGIFEADIWSVNRDGTGQAQVTNADFASVGAAAAPDRSKLAYSRCSIPCFAIFVLDLATGVESSPNPTTGRERHPVFSPDMKRFAFTADPGGSSVIFVMNADGANPTPLTSVPANDDDTNPDWEYVYRCGKRRATIVGDDGPDTIRGTNKKDVIVANGGRDVVRSRGGNDRICLGGGRDRAVGGKGEDRCIGGKGKDKGKGCEEGKL